MAGSPKEKLHPEEETSTEEAREVYLRDGRKLVVSETGGESLVEVRAASGMLELRIRLTEEGPVLQMESVRMELKASEAVEIQAKRVDVVGTESVAVTGGNVDVTAEEDLDLDAKRDVHVTSGVDAGGKIHLN